MKSDVLLAYRSQKSQRGGGGVRRDYTGGPVTCLHIRDLCVLICGRGGKINVCEDGTDKTQW